MGQLWWGRQMWFVPALPCRPTSQRILHILDPAHPQRIRTCTWAPAPASASSAHLDTSRPHLGPRRDTRVEDRTK